MQLVKTFEDKKHTKGWGLKLEGVGEIWVARAREQEREVELTIMPYY